MVFDLFLFQLLSLYFPCHSGSIHYDPIWHSPGVFSLSLTTIFFLLKVPNREQIFRLLPKICMQGVSSPTFAIGTLLSSTVFKLGTQYLLPSSCGSKGMVLSLPDSSHEAYIKPKTPVSFHSPSYH